MALGVASLRRRYLPPTVSVPERNQFRVISLSSTKESLMKNRSLRALSLVLAFAIPGAYAQSAGDSPNAKPKSARTVHHARHVEHKPSVQSQIEELRHE